MNQFAEQANQTDQSNTVANQHSGEDESPGDMSFEQAVERLEQIIEQIESGEIGIEEALKHYESGTGLIKHCRSILDRAESRIAELTTAEDGSLSVTESAGQSERSRG